MSTRPKPRAHRLITISEALRTIFQLEPTRAERQRLVRAIKRREVSSGSEIAVRLAPPPSPLYVTEALLRDKMPEMFSRRDRTLELVKEELDGIRDEIKEAKKRDNVLAARYRKLRDAIADRCPVASDAPGCNPDGPRLYVVPSAN